MTREINSCLVITAIAVASCGAVPTHGSVTLVTQQQLEAVMPPAEALYAELHANPELSGQERRTAATLARRLLALGFEVHQNVGGHGVVGLLTNGPGTVVLMRTDMDALPIEEQTGLPGASRVRMTDGNSLEVPVMHACGHDVHMAAWMGMAEFLVSHRNAWKGKLMLVAQPAEETLSGARALLKDGLYSRFGKPNIAFAIHVHDQLPVGSVGYTYGPMSASVNNVDLVVHGRGGHGAYPQNAIDPIVIASRVVVSLQTIVSRESNPMDPVVVTVGSIHGGTKHNTIPDSVKLELTVRSYKPETQARVLAAIQRIANAEAQAAGAPVAPAFTVREGTVATLSDPARTRQVVEAFGHVFPATALVAIPPEMGSEDFGEYATDQVPTVMLQVGVAKPHQYAAAQLGGEPLTPIHSSHFLPSMPESLRLAILVNVNAALTYFQSGL